MSWLNSAKQIALNLPGWRTNRKIVVFESDDWGSLRSNKKSYNELLKNGIDQDLYSRYDQLESEEDLQCLFEVLRKFIDINKRNPVFTTNTVMANPDFNKIRKTNFQEYYYETFPNTLNKLYPNESVFQLWEQGVNEGLFRPQFHGREHLNVNEWLKDLRSGDKLALMAFEFSVFGYTVSNTRKRNNIMASFDFDGKEELDFVRSSITDGLDLFKEIFGFQSKTMIAPCYIWSKEVEAPASDMGVDGMQGVRFQYQPVVNKNKYKKIFHYTGQENEFGQKYIVRNAFFEPTHFGGKKSVNDVLFRMKIAFALNKPLIIGSHRLNYMGGMDVSNRKSNLKYLEILLHEMLKSHPEIEFMSTDELLSEIYK